MDGKWMVNGWEAGVTSATTADCRTHLSEGWTLLCASPLETEQQSREADDEWNGLMTSGEAVAIIRDI
jgi:hypothetical protein